jgi:LDH2 family malate/lactate/ureidoglycolate dehydrogenase
MAPGDREWAVAETRRRDGIPIDSDTAAFLSLMSPIRSIGNASADSRDHWRL